MSKVGLITKEEAKFFGKLIAKEIKIGGIWSPVINWVLPTAIDTADDKFGDKIPEPWQTDLENLFTMVYVAMQDNVIDEKEETDILNHCALVMNREIDIPWFEEDDEAIMFLSGCQFLASTLRKAVKKLATRNQ